MKEQLELLGWKCSRCACPGVVGYDCAHNDHKGIVIQIKDKRFKIIKRGQTIESGWGYELNGKLKSNELL